MAGGKYNWQKIMALYITGNMTYRELAKQEQVNQKVLERRAKEEGWVNARKEYRRQTAQKAVARSQKADVKKLAALMSAADKLCGILELAVEDPKAFYRYVVQVGDWKTDCVEFPRPDMKAMKDAATTLRELTASVRDLYDLPSQEARHAQQIAAGRLANEERKAKLLEEKAQQDAAQGASIELIGEVADYAG